MTIKYRYNIAAENALSARTAAAVKNASSREVLQPILKEALQDIWTQYESKVS